MITGKTESAPTNNSKAWNQLSWKKCQKVVMRLQRRIVKAVQQGRWGKVKALQHLLTRSFSSKALAVKRVTENQGKNTAGVDRQLWLTCNAKFQGIKQLKQRGYKPSPLKRIYISKSNGKRRPLGIPTIKDRAMQALYLLGLEPIAETISTPMALDLKDPAQMLLLLAIYYWQVVINFNGYSKVTSKGVLTTLTMNGL
ncbi:reverse transcriptase N-terminal domain-containing protein [Candidatus Wolbachia massiliensis]|uniref:reverse transcriptase N-terminal domain-containing protein n=1 Tax=Candidatus Wolbachia massiliensis TaxID=1845000 RepID=UPI001CD0803A|nr:reverse transcriptase N-terminal domain-containing protein [Candidatus Wolbachia massiliensis]